MVSNDNGTLIDFINYILELIYLISNRKHNWIWTWDKIANKQNRVYGLLCQIFLSYMKLAKICSILGFSPL